jgi:hypothetical protein
MRVNPVDVHIGRRLACALQAAGLSATDLATALDTRPARIMRYLDGTERVGAAAMIDVCRVLSLKPSWFFTTSAPSTVAGAGQNGFRA